MTVAELMEKLKTMPQDSKVVYPNFRYECLDLVTEAKLETTPNEDLGMSVNRELSGHSDVVVLR